MKQRIIQKHGFLGDPDIDDASSEARKVQRARHRSGMTGRIKHDLGAGLVRQAPDDPDIAIVFFHKGAASFIELHHCDDRACESGKLQHGKTNGPRADDQDVFSRLNGCTVHGMTADGQRFNKRELLKGQRIAGMQLAGGKNHPLTHRSIAVDAEHLQRLAAVRFALTTGMTGAAIQVGLDRATVPRFQVHDIRTNRQHLDTEFVPEDARIFNERHLSEIAADVCAADPYSPDRHQRLTSSRCRSLGQMDEFKVSRLSEAECFHGHHGQTAPKRRCLVP